MFASINTLMTDDGLAVRPLAWDVSIFALRHAERRPQESPANGTEKIQENLSIQGTTVAMLISMLSTYFCSKKS